MSDAEATRLKNARSHTTPWKKWGPYLSERQWGTVREDYSLNGNAWSYFTHDQARSRAYRWGEDGLAGISDDQQLLCFALALWNGRDPILKERLFGLTNDEGNHGEDVKEYYLLPAARHIAQQGLVPSRKRRHPVDARQMGISAGQKSSRPIPTGAISSCSTNISTRIFPRRQRGGYRLQPSDGTDRMVAWLLMSRVILKPEKILERGFDAIALKTGRATGRSSARSISEISEASSR